MSAEREEPTPEPSNSPKLTWVLIAASLALFCVQLDFFALLLALPPMAADLDVSDTDLQWAVSSYMLALGALFIFGGRIGDIFGRRRALVSGCVLFGAASLACGFAPSPDFLVAARVLQGVGAALIYPSAIGVLSNAFPEERRAWAIGMAYGLGAIGTAIGPFYGGAIAELVTWRLLFWAMAPIALAAAALALAVVRESRDPAAPRRLDWPGLVTVSLGIAGLTMAVDGAESWGWDSPGTIACLVGGVVLLVAFFAIERRVENPLVDLRLFRNTPFVLIVSSGSVMNAAYAVALFLATLYLQNVRGLTPLVAGIIFLAPATMQALAGPISGRIAGLAGPAPIMAGCSLVGGIALLAIAPVDAWPLYVPLFALVGLGLGLGWTYAGVGTQQVVRPERAGEAAGVQLTALVTIGGIAVAIAATALELLSAGTTTQREAMEGMLFAIGGLLVMQAVALAAAIPRMRAAAAAESA